MTRRNGFTLVELVVVILILGILAGVAAPKMFSTSATATDNGLRQTLAVVRDAIELYVSQNGGMPPCTNDGIGANFKTALKSYIRGPFPESPVGPADGNVKLGAVSPLVPDGTTDWMYNATTGEFIANSSDPSATDPATNYSQF